MAGQPPDEVRSSARDIDLERLKWAMHAMAAQSAKPHEVFKTRHLAGLSLCGLSPVPVSVPERLTRGSARQIDPWWHADDVRRPVADEELTEDRRVGVTSRYRIRTEEHEIALLDGRRVTAIREVYYDTATGRHSKELFAEDEEGARLAFNSLPKNLMALEGLDHVAIGLDRDIVVTEGYPAADALRSRGIEAVAILSGTFILPSERALAPLLGARHIVLWPDNDSAGAHLMSRVATALHRMGARSGQITVVLWRGGPRKGDAYDFHGEAPELEALLDQAVTWDPEVRFATSSIHQLSVPRVSPQLRLSDGVQPPTPRLLQVPTRPAQESASVGQPPGPAGEEGGVPDGD